MHSSQRGGQPPLCTLTPEPCRISVSLPRGALHRLCLSILPRLDDGVSHPQGLEAVLAGGRGGASGVQIVHEGVNAMLETPVER